MARTLEDWMQFLDGLSGDDAVKGALLAAWRPSPAIGPGRESACVDSTELDRRQRDNQDLLTAVQPFLGWVASALAHIPHAVHLLDRDGIVLYAAGNRPEWMDALGLTAGQDWSERARGTNAAAAALASDHPAASVGPEFCDRPEEDCTCTAAPIHAPDGTVIGAVGVGTRTADGDPARLALTAHLARLVDRELALLAELAETDQRKNDFLSQLAHELRNPLAPLRNGLAVLRLQLGSDPVIGRIQEMMSRQVEHMVRLIDDLLEVARISRGLITLNKERVEAGNLLARAAEAARPFLEDRRHQFQVQPPPQPFWVEADPVRVTQILTNLLHNSAKYTEPGGRIELSVEHEQEWAVFRVRDNGMGIRPELLSHIFGLFAQGDRPGNRPREGLGLGLSLVKGLTQLHEGTVEARSEGPERGSEFIVRLPLASADTALPASGTVEDKAGTAALRILVVDDNPDGADSLAMVLRLQGHDSRVANDGPTALAAALAFRPHVVLLDIAMPSMDGYEVARRLRQIPQLKGTVLVALTGYGQIEDWERSRAAGMIAHLVKPVDHSLLRELLHQLQGT